MAVPTGEYEMTASVDLTPLFGVIEHKTTVTITRPPENALDVRLEQLNSEDANVRQRALYDLRYFPKEGNRIVPRLVEILESDDANLRSAAISVFNAFLKEAAAHLDLLVGIATGEGSVNERGGAAYLVARVAPKDEKYEKVLTDGVESSEGYMKRRFEGALSYYRRRHGIPMDQ